MKRFISIFLLICLCSAAVFADEQGDEYDDGFVYEQNGAGDQFIIIGIQGCFPLNFGKQLHVGGGATLGYYRFISSHLAVGGDANLNYNVSIGKKPLITAPVVFGVIYQPLIGKFEFPLGAGIGFSTTTCQGLTYFPGFTAKASAGAFYRFNESWSLGVDSKILWLPQWFEDSSKNDNGIFATAGISVRYHF